MDAILAAHQAKQAAFKVVTRTPNQLPTKRMAASWTPHPSPDCPQLILFGGEFMDARQHMYNDLFVYDTVRQEWTGITSPNSPPPRSAHQAVAIDREGGQLFVFGAYNRHECGRYMLP